MAAKLKAGIIPSGQLTALKLRQLIESPNSPADKTVTLINPFDQTNMVSGAALIISSTTAPTDTEALWYDETSRILRQHDGSLWQPFGGRGFIMTNKSGSNLLKGDAVIVDTANDNSFDVSSTNANTKVIGLLGEDVDNNATGMVIHSGPVESSHSILAPGLGRFIDVKDSADGEVNESVTAITGSFARVIAASNPGVKAVFLLFGQTIL